ncbi:metallophosphoesterase [Rhizobium lemnae]|uniref:Metallophosphoesterase family protein n=1 Tax=Rhizobium lemnae TaxID=1214924 RepID=A0ABV8EEZ5_9HYPH|nr:metallophosphoesterase [Rhizobium lemnae]MCJ8510406.1 metallophosphoesterase [Rhizobium lemnae]
MPLQNTIAVIADIHFHDLEADFGFSGIMIDGRRMVVRTWSETCKSTRVFNESAPALHAALRILIDQGIRHVVLLGDYSDDGQRSTMRRLRAILLDYEKEYGLKFYALPGNHDIFGPAGRHQTKEFIGSDGSGILISSDTKRTQNGSITSEDMYCDGYPVGLQPMREFGYYRQPSYIHWETPFGLSERDEDRRYEIWSPDGKNVYNLMDASYLVEPEPGLWLLMIDANIFEPRNGTFVPGEEAAFIDSTAAGWNALMRCKPFLIDWIASVTARAKASGKALLAFSHYPVLDPFDGTSAADAALFGENNVVGRMPQLLVAETLIRCGVEVHFSGHFHAEGVTVAAMEHGEIRNIAVPSLVAYPPALKTVSLTDTGIVVDTISLNDMRMEKSISAAYRHEAKRTGETDEKAFAADDYQTFLVAHLRSLIEHRYFKKEWPQIVVQSLIDQDLRSVCGVLGPGTDQSNLLLHLAESVGLPEADLGEISLIDIIVDWYCLRQGSQLAFGTIDQNRLDLYQALGRLCSKQPSRAPESETERFLWIFFSGFDDFLKRAYQSKNRLEIPLKSPRELPPVLAQPKTDPLWHTSEATAAAGAIILHSKPGGS